MRVLVCGGRDFHDEEQMQNVLEAYLVQGDTVIHGAARGADALAGDVAGRILGYTVEVYPADWAKYGKSAGPIRNQQMLDTGPELVIAMPGGRGTADMIGRAQRAGVKVIEVAP
jgi:hypothetical protein